MKNNILQLGKLIKTSQKILLLSHIRMDTDTFGSMMGLYYILKKMGKEVIAVNDETPPESFAFLGSNDDVSVGMSVSHFAPDMIISLDAASLGQLGKSYGNDHEYFSNVPFVVIDHHMSNPGFGSINIIDTDASSTCELLYMICEELGYISLFDAHIATLLNAGIITDTNMYYNANTRRETLEIASKLIGFGANFRASMFEFYKKKQFASSLLWGHVLCAMQQKHIGEKTITYAIVDTSFYEKTNTDSHALTGIVSEFFINIEGTDIAFIVYALEDGGIKASFRSQGFDVAEFCSHFGGGGHKQASGFTLYNETLENVEKKILEQFKNTML